MFVRQYYSYLHFILSVKFITYDRLNWDFGCGSLHTYFKNFFSSQRFLFCSLYVSIDWCLCAFLLSYLFSFYYSLFFCKFLCTYNLVGWIYQKTKTWKIKKQQQQHCAIIIKHHHHHCHHYRIVSNNLATKWFFSAFFGSLLFLVHTPCSILLFLFAFVIHTLFRFHWNFGIAHCTVCKRHFVVLHLPLETLLSILIQKKISCSLFFICINFTIFTHK